MVDSVWQQQSYSQRPLEDHHHSKDVVAAAAAAVVVSVAVASSGLPNEAGNCLPCWLWLCNVQ